MRSQRQTFYYADGQEPVALAISDASQIVDLHSVADQLIVKWTQAQPDLSAAHIGRRLRLAPEHVKARRHRLASPGLLP